MYGNSQIAAQAGRENLNKPHNYLGSTMDGTRLMPKTSHQTSKNLQEILQSAQKKVDQSQLETLQNGLSKYIGEGAPSMGSVGRNTGYVSIILGRLMIKMKRVERIDWRD